MGYHTQPDQNNAKSASETLPRMIPAHAFGRPAAAAGMDRRRARRMARHPRPMESKPSAGTQELKRASTPVVSAQVEIIWRGEVVLVTVAAPSIVKGMPQIVQRFASIGMCRWHRGQTMYGSPVSSRSIFGARVPAAA